MCNRFFRNNPLNIVDESVIRILKFQDPKTSVFSHSPNRIFIYLFFLISQFNNIHIYNKTSIYIHEKQTYT